MNMDHLSRQRAAFASFLKEARGNSGLNRQDVAQKMGVVENIVEQWENGTRLIDLVELRAYCQAIGLALDKCVEFMEASPDETGGN